MGLIDKLGLPPLPAVPAGPVIGRARADATAGGKPVAAPPPPPATQAGRPRSDATAGSTPVQPPPKPETGRPRANATASGPAAAAATSAVDEAAYRAAFAAMQADYDKAVETRTLFATAANAAVLQRWDDAQKARADAEASADWTAASGALSVLKIAGRDLVQARTEMEAYNAEWAKAKPDFDAGRKFADIEILAVLKVALVTAHKARADAEVAKKWAVATAAIPAVQAASRNLAAKGQAYEEARKLFEPKFAALTNIDAAVKIAAAPPSAVVKQAALFNAVYTKVNDARNAGAFAAAAAALDKLQSVANELLAAKAGDDTRRLGFETELAAVPDLAGLVALAASPPAALAAPAGAFKAADKAVQDARAKGDWDAAKAAVGALKTAAEALSTAKTMFNEGVGEADVAAFDAKIAALKPRSDKALDSPVPPFVVPLQKAVLDRLSAIQGLVAAKDHAGADTEHGKLLAALAAMELGKKNHADWAAAHKATKEGEIAKALAVDLKVAALVALRKKTLDRLEAGIAAAAGQGSFAAAKGKTRAWVDEARAWVGAKDAYDSLRGESPDEATLKKLADTVGGGEVLDALVDDLPDTAKTKVMAVALKARFGFAVKRFATTNKKRTDTTGLTPMSPELPDKPLKKVYQVLGKVPATRLKGKITELVQFDANAGGAAYGGKKVYMYCGRPGDPNASQQAFGKDGDVVPQGEAVEESCKPVDNAPLPYFDFALLHEAGHAEDDAASFMGKRENNNDFGGWVSHASSDVVADIAARHFGYDKAYVAATLKSKGSVPPAAAAPLPKGGDAAAWEEARKKVVEWCQSVRVDVGLWWKPSLSKQVAIGDRVYQEAYDGEWVSYAVSARARGITSYQFRSPAEWFAELYAAWFTKKLKPNHPSATWLKDFAAPKG